MKDLAVFEYENKRLISDLACVNAYIASVSISLPVAKELFNQNITKNEFRGLFGQFELSAGDDFTEFYKNPLAMLCLLVGSQHGDRMRGDILSWIDACQTVINESGVSNLELIALLDKTNAVDVDSVSSKWFFEALRVPRGSRITDVRVAFLLWLADRRMSSEQINKDVDSNDLTRLDVGMDVGADDD